MSRSLSIKGKTQANTALTTTINYVNPNATDEQLVSLATAFNGLTTNTLGDISRIDKESLTNVVPKLPRNVQLLDIDDQPLTEIRASDIKDLADPYSVYIKYNSDDYVNDAIAQYLIAGDNANEGVYSYISRYQGTGGAYEGFYLSLAAETGTITKPLTLTFKIEATNTYQAATFDIPIVL